MTRRTAAPGRWALGCLLAVVLAGCGQATDEGGRRPATPTTIVFASNVNEDEEPAIRRLLTRFEESTKVRVDMGLATRFRDESGIKVKLIRTTATERLHMLLSGRPGFHLFAEDIVDLRPLKTLVQAPGVDPPESVYSKMVQVLRFDGESLFLPFRPNVRLMYANTERLRKADVAAPRTFEEFKDVARRLKDKNGGKPAVTLSLSDDDNGGPAAVTISELILEQGGDPRVLNSDASVRAFQFLRDCWQEALLAKESLFAKHNTEVGYLKSGTAALAQNWSFTSSELAKAGKLDDFEVHPGWQRPSAHVIGGDALGIPRGVAGREKDAAIELAGYLMSEEAQRFLAKEISWPSIQPSINDDLGKGSKTFQAMAKALEEGWYRPTDSYWADPPSDERDAPRRMTMTRAMNQAVERVLRGSEPVKQILDGLHNAIGRDYPGAYPLRD